MIRRALFDYVPGAHRGRPALWGALAAGILAAVLVIGFTGWTPFTGGSQTVDARFATAAHVYPATPVRIHGVDVGTVAGATLMPAGGVDLKLRITAGGVTVHRDASATLLWRTLLGRNMYVALDPGTPGAPALGDAAIPAGRTSSQVELDQVLGSLQPLARTGMRRFFDEFDQGLSGGAPRQAITQLGPSLSTAATAISAFRGQHPGTDLPGFVRGAQRAVAALDSNEAALGGLIDSANVTLGVTATRQADLGSLVSQAPGTLTEARLTMARLRRTLNVLDPVATQLLPGVQKLGPAVSAATPTMQKLTALVPTAVPALRALEPALVSLQSLSAEGVPLLAGLSPTFERTATQIIPFLNERSSTTKLRNYEAIGPFFSAIDSSASTFDAGGFQQRFQPGQRLGTSTVIPPSACSALGSGASSAARQACQTLVDALNGALMTGVKTR